MQANNTFAVIVGIEEYAAGSSWDLKGPANDACRFANWLHLKGVPVENMAVFVSSADKSSLNFPDRLTPKDATLDNIYNSITRDLQNRNEELFYLFWGGHGVITLNEDRHLLCADATENDKRNLNLNALMAFLRTNYFHKTNALSKQVFIVDACANHVRGHKDLPERTFPNGDPLTKGREQYVLLAASPSEYAKNLDTEQTGLFTKELMSLLEAQEGLLPDYSKFTEQLMTTFDGLRDKGKTEQTPAYQWHRDWKGNAVTIGSFKSKKSAEEQVDRKLIVVEKLTIYDIEIIANALMELSSIKDDDKGIASKLSFHSSINLSSGKLSDRVTSMISRCSEYPHGFHELVWLLSSDYETNAFQGFCDTLDKFVKLHTITWSELVELRQIYIENRIRVDNSVLENGFIAMKPSDASKKWTYPSKANLLHLLAYHSQNHVDGLLEFLKIVFPANSEFTPIELNDWKEKVAQRANTTTITTFEGNSSGQVLKQKPSSPNDFSKESLKLDGQLYKELTEAFMAAFPTKPKLTQMLRFGVGEHLDTITLGGNLKDTVFELIQEAERQEWLIDLIKVAREDNPRNIGLKNIEAKVLASYSNKPSETIMSQISNEAKTLLTTASKFNNGEIIDKTELSDYYNKIGVGPYTFGEESARESAKWQHALNELVRSNLVTPKGNKGQIFELTHEGWTLADVLSK